MTDDDAGNAVRAAISSERKLAMRICELSRDQQEAAFEAARASYAEAFVRAGQDPTTGKAKEWIDVQVEGIRALVREMAGRSGNA